MSTIDLHMHSTASDGTTPPGELGALAAEAGLSAIALTDHDTTVGCDACAAGCEQAGVRFVPGIEMSCERGKPAGAMHILGYFVGGDSELLRDVMTDQQKARDERAPLIVEKLNALRFDITMEHVLDAAGGGMIGRPHIAALLVERGYARSIKDAFDRFLGKDGEAYVRKDYLPTARAIEAIHDAGGLAVLAHPVQLRCEDDEELTDTVRRLVDQGLDGLEAYHCDHDGALVDFYTTLAGRYDLLTTGGSDFHGSRKPIAMGSQRVPADLLDRLLEARAARR